MDGLKTRLTGLVLARLVVGFFQRALRLEPESLPGLLFSAMVILLVGAALFLSHRRRAAEDQPKHHR